MRVALTIAALLALAGCGYVGEPLPPASNFPSAVTDLTARQAGDRLEIRATLPEQTLEGLPITKPGEMELRVGPNPGAPFVTERWLASTRQVPLAWPPDKRSLTYSLPAADWAGQDIVLGMRLANPKGRFAGFSNLVAIRVVEPLAQPANLRFTEQVEGIRLVWEGVEREGIRYRVFKKEQGQKEPAPVLAATTVKPEHLDESITYGRNYEYSVQGFLGEAAESLPSATLNVTPKDTFPPAAPTGLTVIEGAQSNEIAWDRATEFDFAFYRVYRAVDDGEFAKLAETGATPSYSDRALQPGRRYRYAVTAVDERGNESARQ
jgi:hypothetical protein